MPVFSTTICWDGTHIASDSQMTMGHKKLWCKAKFHRNEARHAVLAGGGNVDLLDKIERYWMKTDKPLEDLKLPEGNPSSQTTRFQLLVVQDDGTALFYDDDLTSPVKVEAPFAFGSGGDYALAALVMGASAADAIALAEEIDVYTGGTIHVTQAPQGNIAESKK